MSLSPLLDRRQLAEALNVNLPTAENIMRELAIIKIGARCFVEEADVAKYLQSRKAASA